MERTILHCDCNNFYAAVECLYNPSIRNLPVVVAGNVENRHGIILAKNQLAKLCDIKTGDAIWQAKQKCPDLVVVPPNYDKYLRFSRLAREIYYDYTNQVESFGLDECWLDVSGSNQLYGDGTTIADQLRKRIKFELGITISVGVSFNKVFAKLGSDMKKPDATTMISKSNYKDVAWLLPISDLLYVGRQTSKTLNRFGIHTVGDLANTDPDFLSQKFGVNGLKLWCYANGKDQSPVRDIESTRLIKSIGNSTTTPRDLLTDDDVKIILYALCESVAARLRQYNKAGTVVQVSIRDSKLISFVRQAKLSFPSNNSNDVYNIAFNLYKTHCQPQTRIRSLGVRACNLIDCYAPQLSLFTDIQRSQKIDKLENTVDWLRSRFGHYCVQRGLMLTDKQLSNLNPKDDHVIHPEGCL